MTLAPNVPSAHGISLLPLFWFSPTMDHWHSVSPIMDNHHNIAAVYTKTVAAVSYFWPRNGINVRDNATNMGSYGTAASTASHLHVNDCRKLICLNLCLQFQWILWETAHSQLFLHNLLKWKLKDNFLICIHTNWWFSKNLQPIIDYPNCFIPIAMCSILS